MASSLMTISMTMLWLKALTLIGTVTAESTFTIAKHCACSGHTLILECSILSMPGIGGTVWSGGFFSECDTDAVIALLHNRFDLHAGVLNSTKSCNGGSVVGQAIRVLSTNTKNVKYTSQLTVNVSSEMIGQNISCGYDNGVNVSFNVGSISLIGNQIQQETVQFDIRHALVNSHSSLRAINFTWNLLNISECTIIPDQYTVFLSCGSCPTTGITKDSVICTDVPLETELCVFLLVPTICGSVSYNSSAFVDIQLKPTKDSISTRHMGLLAACVLLTIIIVMLLTLICIALLLRFKRILPCWNQFFSTPNAAHTIQMTEAEINTSQYEEINVYSQLHNHSEDGRHVHNIIYGNEDQERGIYSLLDRCTVEAEDATCSALHNIQIVKEASDTHVQEVSLDVNNLLLKVGDLVIAHWHKFGLAIGVPKEFLDQISGEDNKCLTQVLEYWVKHHPGKPTWEEVTDAQKKTLDQLQFELAGMEDTPPPKPPRRRSSVNKINLN